MLASGPHVGIVDPVEKAFAFLEHLEKCSPELWSEDACWVPSRWSLPIQIPEWERPLFYSLRPLPKRLFEKSWQLTKSSSRVKPSQRVKVADRNDDGTQL
jgi:hypothetical protein